MGIEEEIQQTKWKSSLHKAVVNALFTSRFLEDRASRFLKPYDLSLQQFNILRILRGQGDKPATVSLLTERMLDKSSNASRLVDKLLEKKLADRATCPDDRRAVEVRLTPQGLRLLDTIDAANPLGEAPNPSFPEAEAEQLSALLDKLRATMHQ